MFADLWLRDWSTAGDLHLGNRADIDRSAERLLNRSGVTPAQFLRRGTTLNEVDTAHEHRASVADYATLDRTAPRMRVFHGGSLNDDLWPLLVEGQAGLVAVNYGVAQDGDVPTGPTSFRGGHWICVVSENPARSPRVVTVANSLRKTLDVWPWALLVDAAERFGKRPWLNGRGEFGTVAMSPTFLERCRASNAKLKRERDQQRLEIAKLAVQLSDTRKELAECREQAPGDCADEVALERKRWTDWLATAP